MASLTDDDLDGVNEGRKYPDGTVIRVFCMRTDRDAYPSGYFLASFTPSRSSSVSEAILTYWYTSQ